jgi:hypothetical protein
VAVRVLKRLARAVRSRSASISLGSVAWISRTERRKPAPSAWTPATPGIAAKNEAGSAGSLSTSTISSAPSRAISSRGVPSAITFPLRMIAMRSQSFSASSM